MKHVLPKEWFPTDHTHALLAGAIAVKSYAWWQATNAHPHPGATVCYDVDAVFHQTYDPDFDSSATDAEVIATWPLYMLTGDESGFDPLQAFHKQGEDDQCDYWGGVKPPPGNDLSQIGSQVCALDGFDWLEILNKYYFASAKGASWTYLGAAKDNDGDGCKSGRELIPDESIGGRRNPLNPWDYYDVSVPKDGVIDLPNDILGVILHVSPGGLPPYDAYYDRGPSSGPNPWNMTAPDGVIDLPNDVLGVILQANPTGC